MKKYVVNSNLNSALLGDSHRYESEKGIISMVHPCYCTFETYEIYSIKGDLFSDIERYDTLEDAEKRIIELLGKDFKFGR